MVTPKACGFVKVILGEASPLHTVMEPAMVAVSNGGCPTVCKVVVVHPFASVTVTV